MNPDDSDLELVARFLSVEARPRNITWSTRFSYFAIKCYRLVMRLIIGAKILGADGVMNYCARGKRHRITFNGRNTQFRALYAEEYRSGYELETSLVLLRLCRGQRAFYDVGSNWGYFSLLIAASRRFEGKIFSFEPNPIAFADLSQIVSAAGLSSMVTTVNCGLGDDE